MYYVKLKDDQHGRRYKVREALSLNMAIECIWHAQATGSVGGKDTVRDLSTGGEAILADVVEVNSDYTERQPCTMRY